MGMSFSMMAEIRKSCYILPFSRESIKRQRKTIVTLQVRILSITFSKYFHSRHGKKTFPSIPAALTLEAALCLTLFIFAAVCLILPMKVMNTERQLQASLEEIGEDFSRYAYLKQELEQGNGSAVAGAGDFAKGFCRYLTAGIGEGYAQTQVTSHVDTKALEKMSMVRSEILTDGEMVDLVLDYEIRLPFPVLGLPALKRTARCCRRAWIGKAGKDYDGKGETGEADKDTIVYVGKSSTRYHRDRNCHYLSNKLTAVSADQVMKLRNDSGGKYHPCAVCGRQADGIVYIMSDGERYHSNRNCTAIAAYVRAVKLAEVEHMGPCSYCSK